MLFRKNAFSRFWEKQTSAEIFSRTVAYFSLKFSQVIYYSKCEVLCLQLPKWTPGNSKQLQDVPGLAHISSFGPQRLGNQVFGSMEAQHLCNLLINDLSKFQLNTSNGFRENLRKDLAVIAVPQPVAEPRPVFFIYFFVFFIFYNICQLLKHI